MNNLRRLLAGAAMMFSAACTTTNPTPPEVSGIKTSPDDCWAEVLEKYVNAKGQVNFAGVSKDRGCLVTYVRQIAKESPQNRPEKFQDPNVKMAFYLNSYNALAMYGVIVKDIPKDLDSTFKRLNFFILNKYEIGGRHISLYAYENDIIRKLGDPRVHFALNCMSVGCPRLPQVPFKAEILEQQLEDAAHEFFNSPTYMRVDKANKVVYLSEILDFFPTDFVGPGKASSLTEYANKYSREQGPLDYEVKFIPYDWTINRQ